MILVQKDMKSKYFQVYRAIIQNEWETISGTSSSGIVPLLLETPKAQPLTANNSNDLEYLKTKNRKLREKLAKIGATIND